MPDDGLYLKQMELGPMQNFVYLIGCRKTREAAVVDPAWDVEAILRAAEADDMRIGAIVISHTHFDHVNGVEAMLARTKARVHVHKAEGEFLKGFASDLVKVDEGQEIKVGEIGIRLLHTPGHTPGSQCFLVQDMLVAGDTLFIGSCGRTDLPGGSPEDLYHSLTGTLMRLDDRTILYPGHNYADRPVSSIGEERRHNPYLQFTSLGRFLRALGY